MPWKKVLPNQILGIYKFCTDLVIFDREREDRLYVCDHHQINICIADHVIQDVIPYVLSDFISYLVPSILSPTIYVVLVYFISKLRTDELAANLFISIASVRLVRTVQVKSWYADTK